MITLLRLSIWHTRLALQEFAPHMAVLMLPGGYLIALTGWVHRRWPLITAHTQIFERIKSASRIALWSRAVHRIAGVAAQTVSAAR
jgi:hypothetical protein